MKTTSRLIFSSDTSIFVLIFEVKQDVPPKRLKLGGRQPNPDAKQSREQDKTKSASKASHTVASANGEPTGATIKPPVEQTVPAASSRIPEKNKMGKAEKELAFKLNKAHYFRVSSEEARELLDQHKVARAKNRDHPDRMNTFPRIFRNRGFAEPMYSAYGGFPISKQKRRLNEVGNEPCPKLKHGRVQTDEAVVYGADGRMTAPFGLQDDVPLFLDPHASQKGQVETEWVSGRFLRKSANKATYLNETAVTTTPYSNKWATPPALQKFIEAINWGGVRFLSGYSIYPDKFPTNQTIQGALNIASVSQHLWLNPPFADITTHLLHWLNVAIKTNTAFLIISPVQLQKKEFRYVVNLDIVTVVYFQNPIHFHSIQNKYATPGPCPSQICLIMLNIQGRNIYVPNERTGVFPIKTKWLNKLRSLPNSFDTDMSWDDVRQAVEKYKLSEKQALKLCQPQFSFLDMLPSVGSSLDTAPFTPLSPLWSFNLSPLMKQDFPPTYQPIKRECITTSRAEHLLKISNGKFLPQGDICCNLCHSPKHPTSACFLRIPSATELGIFMQDDKILYRFLTKFFKPFEPIEERTGQTLKNTCSRIDKVIDLRKKCFVGKVNKFFATYYPSVSFRWKRPSFSQMRNNLDHHVALGKPLWIIIQIAFGVRYPWLRTPPAISIGHKPPDIDKTFWELQEKELLNGNTCITPEDWPECLHRIFGLESSDKLRSIHNLRYLNGYLPSFKYQQENLEDFIHDLQPGDLLWFEDMKGCFQQFTLCPRDRKRFGFQFIYDKRKYTIVPNYCLFGASLNPFFVKERFKEEVRILRMILKNALLWIDDLNGLIRAGTPPEVIQTIMIFCKNLWEGGGVIFGPKGVRWNPVPTIKSLGWHILAPLLTKRIPANKIEALYLLCESLLKRRTTTLQELSKIAGKFLAYGPPIAKLFTSELFRIMSQELMNLAFKEKLTENKGDLRNVVNEVTPTTYNFLDLSSSPGRFLPIDPSPAQLNYQRTVQANLTKLDTSITFAKLQHFQTDPSNSALFSKQIPVHPKLAKIFANWFDTLSEEVLTIKHPSLVNWQKAFFVNSDASEIGVGINLLFQEKGKPWQTRILLSEHYALPAALQSLINKSEISVIRSSCAREAFGIWCAVSALCTRFQMRLLKPLPIFIFTDSLAVSFVFKSQHATHHITQKYMVETLKMLHQFNQPFEILWKRRSEPSAMSADLASKLPPWSCSSSLESILKHRLKLGPKTKLIYPIKPLELLHLRMGRIPPGIESWNNRKNLLPIIIVPPNLQKQTYGNVLECFNQFKIKGLLIVPGMKYKAWYSNLVKQHGIPLLVKTGEENFNSSIFRTITKFHFQMAVFNLTF